MLRVINYKAGRDAGVPDAFPCPRRGTHDKSQRSCNTPTMTTGLPGRSSVGSVSQRRHDGRCPIWTHNRLNPRMHARGRLTRACHRIGFASPHGSIHGVASVRPRDASERTECGGSCRDRFLGSARRATETLCSPAQPRRRVYLNCHEGQPCPALHCIDCTVRSRLACLGPTAS